MFVWGLMLIWVMSVGFEYTCTVLEKENVSRVIPKLYEWIYKTWRLFLLVDELRIPNQDDPRLHPVDS